MAHLSCSTISTFLIIRMNFFAAACSTMPADCNRKIKGPELPSIMGISEAFTSTITLSTPKPANADIKCSTVATRAPFFSRAEHMRVSLTASGVACISGIPGKSVRLNTIPESIAAGRRVNSTFTPLCNPTPVALTFFFRVLCFNTYFPIIPCAVDFFAQHFI